MVATTVSRSGSISVIDYRCSVEPADEPFVELHGGFSVSYVRKGGFGYRVRGESFERVAGSIRVGHPGDEYMCTHDLHERRALPVGPCTLRRLFYSQRSDRRRC